jgi:hypothetical protein
LKVRASQLNFFDRGAKFVSRSIDEMFDVVTELIDASVPHIKRRSTSDVPPARAARPKPRTTYTAH